MVAEELLNLDGVPAAPKQDRRCRVVCRPTQGSSEPTVKPNQDSGQPTKMHEGLARGTRDSEVLIRPPTPVAEAAGWLDRDCARAFGAHVELLPSTVAAESVLAQRASSMPSSYGLTKASVAGLRSLPRG